MPSAPSIRRALDWGSLTPLRLRASLVAEGVYAGAHRSARRGAGVEFGGHREYTPGDDLRWLDQRSLLRHDRLLVRQFETETDRALRLVVDATASMGYRGASAPGAKLAWAALITAALARIALFGGDPVGLSIIGGSGAVRPVPRSGGREQFERIVASLEALEPGGDSIADTTLFEQALATLARARRGAVIVLLSDLIDVPELVAEAVAALGHVRRVVVVQTLDPDEADFPFQGTVRVRSLEGHHVVETDGTATRAAYLSALAALRGRWQEALTARGGRLVYATTSEPPVGVVRRIVAAIW